MNKPSKNRKRPRNRVGSGGLVLRSVVQRVNDLLLVRNATGVSAEEICNVVADAIGDRINAESSSPEFRSFFLTIDREKARGLLGLPQNTTLSHAGTSARKQDGAATGVGSGNS